VFAADQDRLVKLAEGLGALFYVLMLGALVCAVAGSPGSGLLLLILGSCAHVGRVGAEALVDEQHAPRVEDDALRY